MFVGACPPSRPRPSPPPPSSSAAVIEAAAPENPVSAGDQSEPSAVVADVQEAVAEAKLEAGAQSKLLPQYTNIEVHNALHAYGTHGINVQGAPEGTQRWLVSNYLNYRGPSCGRPFYKPWEGEKVLRLPLFGHRQPCIPGRLPTRYYGALVSACITQGGEIVAAGDVVTNKPKPRGAASRDGNRVSLCMAILIPSPELSGGDKAVKVVVVPYRVSGLI